MTTSVEFAVQISCDTCVTKIEKCLEGVEGVKNVKISRDEGTVLVESSLPSSVLQEKLESTGRKAVLKGCGDTGYTGNDLVCKSAVAMLGGTQGFSCDPNLQGVIRFIQTRDDTCVIDGTLDGLSPGNHGLYIYQCGDLTQGCQSIGDHYDICEPTFQNSTAPGFKKHAGDLGNIEADESGRAVFKLENRDIKVWDVIGRSVGVESNNSSVLTQYGHHPSTRLACGIISRSAGLFENAKKICACDGVTLWDERDKPLAGPGRQARL